MRRDAVASQASRNAVGELGKPPLGSRIPASRGVEDPRRCFGIVRGPLSYRETGIRDRMGIICWILSTRRSTAKIALDLRPDEGHGLNAGVSGQDSHLSLKKPHSLLTLSQPPLLSGGGATERGCFAQGRRLSEKPWLNCPLPGAQSIDRSEARPLCPRNRTLAG